MCVTSDRYGRRLFTARQKSGNVVARVFFIALHATQPGPAFKRFCVPRSLSPFLFPPPPRPSFFLPPPPAFYPVLFSERTRFESTRNTRRLGMHRPVMHCFQEAIAHRLQLCAVLPRRNALAFKLGPRDSWESKFT